MRAANSPDKKDTLNRVRIVEDPVFAQRSRTAKEGIVKNESSV